MDSRLSWPLFLGAVLAICISVIHTGPTCTEAKLKENNPSWFNAAELPALSASAMSEGHNLVIPGRGGGAENSFMNTK